MSYYPALLQQLLLSGVQVYNRPHLLAATLNQLEIVPIKKATTKESVLRAQCGCQVELLDLEDTCRSTFELVMPCDAAPERGRLSVLSPLGSKLLGLRKHEIAHIQVWRRNYRFQVLNIVQL